MNMDYKSLSGIISIIPNENEFDYPGQIYCLQILILYTIPDKVYTISLINFKKPQSSLFTQGLALSFPRSASISRLFNKF